MVFPFVLIYITGTLLMYEETEFQNAFLGNVSTIFVGIGSSTDNSSFFWQETRDINKRKNI